MCPNKKGSRAAHDDDDNDDNGWNVSGSRIINKANGSMDSFRYCSYRSVLNKTILQAAIDNKFSNLRKLKLPKGFLGMTVFPRGKQCERSRGSSSSNYQVSDGILALAACPCLELLVLEHSGGTRDWEGGEDEEEDGGSSDGEGGSVLDSRPFWGESSSTTSTSPHTDRILSNAVRRYLQDWQAVVNSFLSALSVPGFPVRLAELHVQGFPLDRLWSWAASHRMLKEFLKERGSQYLSHADHMGDRGGEEVLNLRLYSGTVTEWLYSGISHRYHP